MSEKDDQKIERYQSQLSDATKAHLDALSIIIKRSDVVDARALTAAWEHFKSEMHRADRCRAFKNALVKEVVERDPTAFNKLLRIYDT